MNNRWPVVLKDHDIYLRPLRFRDRAQWNRVRAENREWLSQWEATIPPISEESYKELPSFFEMVRILNHEARHGQQHEYVDQADDQRHALHLAGQSEYQARRVRRRRSDG